ncbi:hypothetical protein KUTeg_002145 [Tegillarca granosa]|uniref:Coatomer subunit beta' n=1 Tax=Tegillarca granosa TaxID=220873 RepID=A0ABQ9FTH5_TEGGR|nr:hypothetical protein KUTeg_002145 [Tegillarca granosa]
MPLRLDIKRKLSARSDRVKCVDLHPTEPWMLASLYNGNVHIWNHESQTLIKSFEVCDLPVRAVKFVPRKNWLCTGSDDMQIRVYNYNTLERVHQFEAHSDYIRCIAVHPTQPFIITSSDDMLIKLWDWEKKWTCTQVFEGHTHYVMQIVINPKDNNTFASASLDRTVKVWQLGSQTPNFTLEGHEKGVNCVDYYTGGDKPYLISGADDRLVKIWDYQIFISTCICTLVYHYCQYFSGTVRIWHANTYRLESTLNYGLERVWTIACQKGSNNVALGYDEGSIIIKLGREEPAMSMDSSGKIIWAKHSEIQQANIKAIADQEIKDGERFVVVCGDGEYIIYTAMALRNKSFGSAQEFVWSNDSSVYAIRESTSSIKIFKNFKELKSFKPDFGAEGIYGGNMLGVRSVSGLAFYDWDSTELIRRIEITPKNVVGEIEETVKTGIWVGDCFIYTNSVNRLNYYVGGEIVTVAHLDRVMYILGYIPKDNRVYLGDKELNVVSFSLLVSVLEYQTAVMRRDFETADKVLPTVPREHRTRVAHFLEKQGFKSQAMAVTCDSEHKFELSLQLGDLKTAYQLAKEMEADQKWKQLAELAVSKCEFGLAQECLHQAQDFAGLLLLASSAGNADMVAKLGDTAEKTGQNNVAFLSHFILGRVLGLWREVKGSLADPPGMEEALKTEEYLQPERRRRLPANKYPEVTPNSSRNALEETKQAEESGEFIAGTGAADEEEEEDFELAGEPQKEEKVEKSKQKVEEPKQKVEEPKKEQAAPAKVETKYPTDIDIDSLEKELELDIENMNLDENFDPSEVLDPDNSEDVNLDEELLED